MYAWIWRKLPYGLAGKITGSVLLGLIDAGEARSTAAQRAAEYLVSTQQRDGAWPNGDCVATLVPPNLFYVYGTPPPRRPG